MKLEPNRLVSVRQIWPTCGFQMIMSWCSSLHETTHSPDDQTANPGRELPGPRARFMPYSADDHHRIIRAFLSVFFGTNQPSNLVNLPLPGYDLPLYHQPSRRVSVLYVTGSVCVCMRVFWNNFCSVFVRVHVCSSSLFPMSLFCILCFYNCTALFLPLLSKFGDTPHWVISK